MVFPEFWWILLIVSGVLCAVGFYKFVYFLSIGYGLAVAGLGVTMAILMLTGANGGSFSIPLLAQCALFVVYGFRLSGFLLLRELKNASYRKTLKEATKEDEKPMPFFVKFAIWVCCAALYVMQVSPVFYRSSCGGNPLCGSVSTWIGAAVMLAGILLEALADKQKSAQKKERPDMVATKGLYKMCRCPNYFGEIVFWTGVLVSGVTILRGWQWLIALLGWVCIVYIMFNGAQRLEKRQNGRYGQSEEYKQYVSKTPIIIPLLPVYHLTKEEKK